MPLYQRPNSSNWWLKISVNGEVIQRSTGTPDKSKAQEYHDKLKASLWEQKRLGIKPKRYWHEAVVRWLEETSDKRTHLEDIKKLRWLDGFLGHLSLDEITVSEIDQVKATKLKDAKKTTVNRYLALVRAILRKAQNEWAWIDKAVYIQLYKEPRGRERSLTKDELNRLIQELPEHLKSVVSFAVLTGLRQGNISKLEWSWVDLSAGYLTVPATSSKNNRPITIPLGKAAIEILQQQLGKHSSRVFTFKGKPIATLNTRAWRKALKRASIEDFRWHDLRHTFATYHRLAGTPTHELQKLGAWQSQAMVERYAHIAPKDLKGAPRRLENFING